MKKRIGLITLVICLLICSLPSNAIATEPSFEIHFIDVGQADAAVVICDGKAMIIDGGNVADSSLVYSYLTTTLGLKHLDYLIATHPHEDL